MLPNYRTHLDYICKLMYESFQLPVFYLNVGGQVEMEYASNYINNPLYPLRQTLLQQLFSTKDPAEFPVLKTTNYMENFFSVVIQENDQFHGMIIVGPSLDSQPSKDTIHALLGDVTITNDKQELFINYYESLPVLSNLRVIYAGMHLYYMIYQKMLDTMDVIQKNKELDDSIIDIEEPSITISQRRQEHNFHHDRLRENQTIQYIKDGKPNEVIKNYRALSERGDIGVLSKRSHLRNMKNLGITAITLSTRAAMDGGINHEVAYTLSDLYIQQLEELKTVKEVNSQIEDAMVGFAERVKKRQQQNYSKPINICLSYIFNHLYESITLYDLAELVDMHPNYLSTAFKREVGISLQNYIQKTKVDESKTLIQFSNYSLLEISTLLNFHDQSYFTKIFKKYTGVTPHQYRNQN